MLKACAAGLKTTFEVDNTYNTSNSIQSIDS